MKKKFVLFTFIFIVLVSLVACNKTSVTTTTTATPTTTITLSPTSSSTKSKIDTTTPPDKEDLSFSYYKTTDLREDKKIYVLNATSENYAYSNDQLILVQAIQGLFARKNVTFYVDSHYMTNGTNIDMYYLEQAKEEYGLTIEYISLEEAVEIYKDAWAAMIADKTWGSEIVLSSYNNTVGVDAYTEVDKTKGFSTPGYIVYKKGDVSVNIAATLAAITGFLPVDSESVETYKALGLTEKFNVNSAALSYKWLFNIVMSELSTSGLIHQNYQQNGNTNQFIKDYGICNKYFHIYYDDVSIIGSSFKKSLHSFLDKNCPIFGYTYQEDSDVAFFSQYGQFIVPTDYSCNMTFLAAKEFSGQTFTQPNDDSSKAATDGKHYVAFVVSDGDNATYWQNTAAFATNYMNASGRENDTFPVTWSMTPSLVDLMPQVIDNVYNYQANDYDYFCAPVSGQGYINAGNFENQNDGAYFDDFCDKLDIYMKKADLSVVTVIGGNSQNNLVNVLKGYASCENVTGGIVYDGSKYFGSVRGGVIWIDGKPFVGPRDSLWETTPAYIAARINTYGKDITRIDAYSIINVHPWSHSYDDIRTIVSMLNEDIEVVSVDRIINMMSDNIEDKSNTTSFNIPEKNGISISQSYLQENPSLIPVNPLFNDFLLWEEDWSGSGVKYNSSDPACSNVGAIYKGNITIKQNTTAVKREFLLPDIDNYWFSLNARCDSVDKTHSTTFTVSMTVDGVKKVVMKDVTIKGVTGTETRSVKGDGWQCFAFPISQYFKEYRGKTCQVEISVNSGDQGIRIDQVAFKERTVDPGVDQSSTNIYNNSFDKNTEDWMLGEQYKTSQYYWWNTIDRESLNETSSIQIDSSDGGGDEKRNGNTNMWMAKHYVLPEASSISLSFKVTSDNITGAMMKISMYIDGEYLVLFDWQVAHASLNNVDNTINLFTTFENIDFSAKEITIVMEVRDGGNNNGVGEACKLHDFVTISN